MTLLVIGNLSRLGALRNMLVDEFEASCPAQEDNMFRTIVQKHKTSKTYGAAGIYLTVSLKRHIERYLKERKTKFKDSEKQFLGTNSAFCLENITALLDVQGQVDGFQGTSEFDSDADVLANINPALLRDDAQPTGSKRPAPTDLHPPRKRNKNTDNLYLFKRCIEENPDVGSLQEMVTIYKNSEDYQALCDIFFDQRADKYWNMAQQECPNQSQDADILRRLNDLPDSLRHMMTPEQTLALFNAWCVEQDINARALAWVIIACLQGRVYKKIGVYLQGASNSGKTYWSSTLFQPLSKLVGKMTTGGRFCLQDCVNKRIIVGEELLRICKDWHGTDKEAGRMMQTWEEWLKSVINISASHSRRLQQLAHLLYPFPMFFHVGLSQNEIFCIKKQIEQLLKLVHTVMKKKTMSCSSYKTVPADSVLVTSKKLNCKIHGSDTPMVITLIIIGLYNNICGFDDLTTYTTSHSRASTHSYQNGVLNIHTYRKNAMKSYPATCSKITLRWWPRR
ncbi:hypothetical protein RRG08_012369 [Elysia crispata]|uniref:Uncharacterized protein n=1 Tax=Elysia crispata TaxID=231223 RepID=A0AAE0ZPL8_9GAST|nr:hypothetical protein RRG08_012369 [Elysia crispata]